MKTFKTSRGTIQKESRGRLSLSFYKGKFFVPSLQEKADTGLWYANLIGFASNIYGSGLTPERAIEDLKKRYIQRGEAYLKASGEIDVQSKTS